VTQQTLSLPSNRNLQDVNMEQPVPLLLQAWVMRLQNCDRERLAKALDSPHEFLAFMADLRSRYSFIPPPPENSA